MRPGAQVAESTGIDAGLSPSDAYTRTRTERVDQILPTLIDGTVSQEDLGQRPVVGAVDLLATIDTIGRHGRSDIHHGGKVCEEDKPDCYRDDSCCASPHRNGVNSAALTDIGLLPPVYRDSGILLPVLRSCDAPVLPFVS